MATTIKLKNGSGAPTTGDLVQGEPAFDLTNKRLYTEDSGGTVIEVGTNPGTDVTFADNRKAIFGAGSDLQIYHDGSHSRIDEQGTGVLFLQTNGTNIQLNKGTSENMLVANVDGSVDLYFDNAKKLATTSIGIDVTGTVTSDKAIVGYSRAAGTGGIVLYDDDQAENRLSLLTGGGTGINAVINQAGGSLNITDASLNAVATFNDGGNVGIGTTSPDNKFHVVSGSAGEVAQFTGEIEARGLSIRSETNTDASAHVVFNSQSGGSKGMFTFETDSTERMRIDSSGNVGIGTTPNQQGSTKTLHIQNASGATLKLEDGTDEFDIQNVGGTGFLVTRSANPIAFYTNSSERMRIDSNGQTMLAGSTAAFDNTGAVNGLQFHYTTTTGKGVIGTYSSGGSTSLAFRTNSGGAGAATDNMIIDSSGNLLVGTTNANPTSSGVNDPGVELSNTGGVRATVASNPAATFNRKTDDGAIAIFRKDGTTVGSISSNGSNLQINGTGALELQENGTTRAYVESTGFHPWADNTYDLGTSSARWKDLYLSGGAYLGGTGAANHLDDYEEGTHNTTISVDGGSATFSNIALAYTKIGRLVSVAGTFRVDTISSPTGSLTFTLPFTSISGSGELQTGGSVVPNLIANANCNELLPQVAENASACTIFNASGNNLADAANTLAANATYRINLVYYTS